MNAKDTPHFTSAESSQWHKMFAVEDSHWWFHSLRVFIFSLLNVPVDARQVVLDIGCGSGGFLAALQRRGWPAIGLDISRTALECVKARNNEIPLIEADANSLPITDETVDLLFSLDVIETRWVETEVFLSEISRVVKVGGTVCIVAAAFQFLLSEHDQAVGSVRRFTRPELKRLFEKQGFHVEHARYLFCFLFPLIAFYKLVLHRRKRNTQEASSAISVTAPSVNGILRACCGIESFVQPYLSMPFGSSLLVIARKVRS